MTRPANPLAMPHPWDLVAAAYAREVVPHFESYARDAMQLAKLAPGSRVLDVACGPGTLALLVARDATQVTAVDFSHEMVTALRARVAEHRLDNVEVAIGDGQALELPDRSFDAAFSMFGLMFFPDRARGLREVRRVLVPGGRVAISSWLPMSDVPLLAAIFSTLREKLPQLPSGDDSPLGTAEEMRSELEAAGFHDVEAHRVAHALEYPDAGAFTGSLRRTLAPLALLAERLGEDGIRPIEQAIHARIVEVAGPGAGQVTMPAWIGVGTA